MFVCESLVVVRVDAPLALLVVVSELVTVFACS